MRVEGVRSRSQALQSRVRGSGPRVLLVFEVCRLGLLRLDGTMGFGFDYGLGLRVSSAKWILVVCASEPCAFRSNGTKAPPIEASGPD